MADFCRESGEGFNDFSIKEEFDKLELGFYKPIICEAMGFSAVAKSDEGKCQLIYQVEDDIVIADFDLNTNTVITNDERLLKRLTDTRVKHQRG